MAKSVNEPEFGVRHRGRRPRCPETESGGYRCELEPHPVYVQHWISQRTIDRASP